MASRDFKTSHYFPSSREAERKLTVPGWAIIGIFLILAVQMIAAARTFLMPVSLGLLLFFVFSAARRAMMRRGLSSGLTAAIITLGLLVGIGGLGYVVSGPVSSLMENSESISQRLQEKAKEVRSKIKPLEEAAAKIDELSSGIDAAAPPATPAGGTAALPGATTTAVTSEAGGAVADTTVTTARVPAPAGTVATKQDITVKVDATAQPGMSSTLLALGPEIASQFAFTLLLLFFLLDAGDLLYLKIVQSFDSMRDKRAAYMALREIEDSLGAYLGAISLINALLGVAMALAMWAWGMPSPVLFGIAMFLSNYIPYIGAFLIFALSGIVGTFIYDDLWHPMLIALTSMALTSIEGQFVTPYFVSRRLQLNTVVVFLTVALWAWLWSVLGMIVAVPMLVVLRVLADHIPGLQKFANFLAGEAPPQLEDDDEEEARAVVEAGGDEPDTPAAAVAVAQASTPTAAPVEPERTPGPGAGGPA